MGRKPGLVFLVNAVIVQNHMDFLSLGQVADHLIHKLQELQATLLLSDLGANRSGRDFQGRKQFSKCHDAYRCP